MKTGLLISGSARARVALLAGVSAVALLAAGSANAQGVVNSPFVVGDTYGVGKGPKGVDLSQVSIPGLGAVSTTPGVLETNNAASTPVAQTTDALNSDGTPKKPTYATEIAGGASSVAGTGNNAGSVLANSQNGDLIAAAPRLRGWILGLLLRRDMLGKLRPRKIPRLLPFTSGLRPPTVMTRRSRPPRLPLTALQVRRLHISLTQIITLSLTNKLTTPSQLSTVEQGRPPRRRRR